MQNTQPKMFLKTVSFKKIISLHIEPNGKKIQKNE